MTGIGSFHGLDPHGVSQDEDAGTSWTLNRGGKLQDFAGNSFCRIKSGRIAGDRRRKEEDANCGCAGSVFTVELSGNECKLERSDVQADKRNKGHRAGSGFP